MRKNTEMGLGNWKIDFLPIKQLYVKLFKKPFFFSFQNLDMSAFTPLNNSM